MLHNLAINLLRDFGYAPGMHGILLGYTSSRMRLDRQRARFSNAI